MLKKYSLISGAHTHHVVTIEVDGMVYTKNLISQERSTATLNCALKTTFSEVIVFLWK